MEKLANTLHLSNINVNYLNIAALYDYSGSDLVKLKENVTNGNSNEINKLREKYSIDSMLRHGGTPIILSFFRHILGITRPHKIVYNKDKFIELSPHSLNYSNREVFISILKYFLEEDIIFLNTDAIYDDLEKDFCLLIDSLRNNTCEIVRNIMNPRTRCEHHGLKIRKANQNISVFHKSDLMIYVEFWCHLMLAKIRSIDTVFGSHGNWRFVHVLSGDVDYDCGEVIRSGFVADFF